MVKKNYMGLLKDLVSKELNKGNIDNGVGFKIPLDESGANTYIKITKARAYMSKISAERDIKISCSKHGPFLYGEIYSLEWLEGQE
jgi:hypothetical protein